MHKKKIQALIAAGVLSVGVIGGTLAWFTSEDSVTNIFNTGAVDNPDIDGGIDVDENFKGPDGSQILPDENGNSTYPKPVLPDDFFTKQVWVDSEANYDQFVRARIEKSWKIGVAQPGSIKVPDDTHGNTTDADTKPDTLIIPQLAVGTDVTHYAIVKALVSDSTKIESGTTGETTGGTTEVYNQFEDIVIYSENGTEEINGVTWEPLDYSKIQLGFTDSKFGSTSDKDTWFAPKDEDDKDDDVRFNLAWENDLERDNSTGKVTTVDTTDKSGWYYYNKILEPKPAKTVNILESVTFRADNSEIDGIYKTLRFDVKVEGESVQASNGAAADLGWDTTVPVAIANQAKYGEAKTPDSGTPDPGTETKN